MSGFAIRNPYFIVVVCLIIAVVGVTSLARMPVDMFPSMDIPVVVVATFYTGMPPEQIETDITSRFERFFTLGSGIEHIESRSLPGVSIIKVYFQPGTNPDSAVTTISNLAMAQLRRLPPGTLPPVVLKFDASSLPVCLVTFKGEGLNETAAARPGAVPGAQPDRQRARRQRAAAVRRHVPPDHGLRRPLQAGSAPAQPDGRGPLRQQLQPDSARRRRADRPLDYNIYTNSQLRGIVRRSIELPVKTVGQCRPSASPISATPRTRSRSRPTSCASMASARSTCRC